MERNPQKKPTSLVKRWFCSLGRGKCCTENQKECEGNAKFHKFPPQIDINYTIFRQKNKNLEINAILRAPKRKGADTGVTSGGNSPKEGCRAPLGRRLWSTWRVMAFAGSIPAAEGNRFAAACFRYEGAEAAGTNGLRPGKLPGAFGPAALVHLAGLCCSRGGCPLPKETDSRRRVSATEERRMPARMGWDR